MKKLFYRPPGRGFSDPLTDAVDDRETLVSCWLDRSAEFCYRLFCDAQAVPRWLPVVDEARVHARDPQGRALRAEFVGSLQAAAKVSYTLDYTYDDANHRVRWNQTEGGVTALTGSATFTPTDEGGCLLEYRLRAELPEALPGWGDALYSSSPSESVVVQFCEWVCKNSGQE